MSVTYEMRLVMFRRAERPSPAGIDALRAMPMFAGLPDAMLRHVDRNMAEITLGPGAVLTRENEYGREAFIVAEGIAEVHVDGVAISSVGPGDLVGEMSLLDGGPRTATVVALTTLRVFVLDPREFGQLFSDPHAARWIAATLSQRLREQPL
ncbi:MAG: cyclic nucleotide-binding domain-containing protein [Actinomycetota bacterium]|nr:cyclic nucleotide-binding domain-containing protein [Actinomycetota bacterium]